MDAMDPSVLRYGTLTLQAATLLKLIFLLVSFLRSASLRSFCSGTLAAWISKYHKQIQSWWRRQGRDSASAELDEMRCLWARRLMTVIFVFAMLRLILHEAGASHPYNLTNLVMATLGLFFFSFPRLINPSNQDVWYVAVMLSLDASILVQVPEVDVRDVVPFAFAGRILYAVLAKRIGCVVFCVLVHLLQAIQISRSQEDPPGILYGAHNLIPMFLMMFVCIIAVRRLVRENVVLRVDLQKRTVELGAVSSLLTACYDAVIEVDRALSLTQDSSQLASMLLQTAPKLEVCQGNPCSTSLPKKTNNEFLSKFSVQVPRMSQWH